MSSFELAPSTLIDVTCIHCSTPISAKSSAFRAAASTRVAIYVLAATFSGCGGTTGDGGNLGSGGGLAVGDEVAGDTTALEGATDTMATAAGGASLASVGSMDTSSNASSGGSVASGGASTVGASTTGVGGSSVAPGASGEGGAANGAGGATSADGGAATALGGAASGEGGAVNGQGGAMNAEGGAATDEGGGPAIEIDPDALYVAPDGSDGASGTIDDPTTLSTALQRVNAGGTIYLRAGTYPFGSTIGLSKSGSDGSPITLSAYPLDDEHPLFDFSSMSENSSNRGMSLSGNYWHVYGLDLFQAGDNCLFVSGSNNTIEYSTFSECADTGLQLGNGAANNLVLNCDSFFNADSTLENADGFAAKLDVGTGNKFVGCRAWNNLDDGWDGYLRPADNVTTTYEDCWAIDNGKLKNGSAGVGDGNGFKTGGSDGKNLRHNVSYERCIASGNVNDGFDHNSNRGNITILNSAAHNNGNNINFGATNIAASLTIKNTISLGKNGELLATNTDISDNSWQGGLSATNDDFISVDPAQLKSPRKSDGSLPDIDYLKLVPGSDLRNAGIDLGLPYNGSAPDLGPFESDE